MNFEDDQERILVLLWFGDNTCDEEGENNGHGDYFGDGDD